MIILEYIFLFLNENISCRYSLEAPRRGASNGYPQHMFLRRTGENYPRIITKYSSLTIPLDKYDECSFSFRIYLSSLQLIFLPCGGRKTSLSIFTLV